MPDYLRDFIQELYAVDANGKRIVRQALLTLPRRNGKTLLTSALTLLHLCGPEAEPRGLCVSAAADRTQAAGIFEEMKAFIIADADLSGRIVIRDFAKSLEDVVTGSIYRALASDVRKAHGLGPSFIACDETSQWRDRGLYDGLVSGMGARSEPLAITISTRSGDPSSLTEELVDYGQKCRSGIIHDPSFIAHIHSASLDADWTNPATWRACNPAVAAGWLDIEDLRIACEQAQRIPAREAGFKLLRLNMPVSADDRWLNGADWDACGHAVELTGPVYAGLDLASGAGDLSAFALYAPETGALRVWAFLPDQLLDAKAAEDRAPYDLWRNQGHVVALNGKALDRAALGQWIASQTDALDLQGIASDRWGLEDLRVNWAREGLDTLAALLMPNGAGYKDMSPAMTAFERAVLSGHLGHSQNPLLRWAVSNIAVETDPAGNRKPAKNRSRGRIDPCVSAILAVGLASRAEVAASYEFTGMMVL